MATGIGSINNNVLNTNVSVEESREASDLDSKYSQDNKFNMTQLGVELGKMLNKTRDAARELSKQQQVNAVGYAFQSFETNKDAINKSFIGGLVTGAGGLLGGATGVVSSGFNCHKFRSKGNQQVKVLTKKDDNNAKAKLDTLMKQPHLNSNAGKLQEGLKSANRIFDEQNTQGILGCLRDLKTDNLKSLHTGQIEQKVKAQNAKLAVCRQKISKLEGNQQKNSTNTEKYNKLIRKQQALEDGIGKITIPDSKDKNNVEGMALNIKQLKRNDSEINSLQRDLNKVLDTKSESRANTSTRGVMCDGIGRLGTAGFQIGGAAFTKASEQLKGQVDFISGARSNTQQNAGESLDSAKKFSQEVSSIMKDMVTLNGNLASALGKI